MRKVFLITQILSPIVGQQNLLLQVKRKNAFLTESLCYLNTNLKFPSHLVKLPSQSLSSFLLLPPFSTGLKLMIVLSSLSSHASTVIRRHLAEIESVPWCSIGWHSWPWRW